jgi:hypothetical protein
MKHMLRAVCASVLCLPASAIAGEKSVSSTLTETHTNASQTLRFRTPPGWKVETREGEPEITEARGGGLILRLVRRAAYLGLDSLHVDCMLIRLADDAHTNPVVEYEYDFVGGALAEREVLDSAFVVHYDEAIEGSRDWRQRNVSVAGQGESVCVIGYGPAGTLRRSKPSRALLDAVMASVEFRPWH